MPRAGSLGRVLSTAIIAAAISVAGPALSHASEPVQKISQGQGTTRIPPARTDEIQVLPARPDVQVVERKGVDFTGIGEAGVAAIAALIGAAGGVVGTKKVASDQEKHEEKRARLRLAQKLLDKTAIASSYLPAIAADNAEPEHINELVQALNEIGAAEAAVEDETLRELAVQFTNQGKQVLESVGNSDQMSAEMKLANETLARIRDRVRELRT